MSDHASSRAMYPEIIDRVRDYYEGKLDQSGTTPRGVDWNSVEGQEIRFAQLRKAITHRGPFSINDYGCGYGALADFLQRRGDFYQYHGFDISSKMVREAQKRHVNSPNCQFTACDSDLQVADYTVASFPMLPIPFRITNNRLLDFLKVFALDFDRYSQPQQTLLALYFISIAPVSFRVLHIVIQNKFINKIY